ncbi:MULTISPECIES: precorrin-8X methylmutase [Megasphaera]|uniref:Precorrin-8X methylmutase n=1 Tax=Megasphaera vaginalis (ex Srinivasan et al. 2021) TaxID=1111454 RepID=U7UQN0_9FIRM|nr:MULTISPECIES: precorrin-8X methylmutase [Megasphaera]ERT61732.1 precorrin-8X methylmutase [Megasphaera vaginalis (ex Srinivasan et al. 2021)]
MEIEHVLPQDIERRSMEIIDEELGEITIAPEKLAVVKRVIHTSADFEYARTLRFSGGAVASGLAALQQGCTIVTDTNMACTGINQGALHTLGCRKVCFMADVDVAAAAKAAGTTRAAAAMRKAAALAGPLIVAVGNAPTALFSLAELIDSGAVAPALVIAVPVGFVNVVQAKERIMACSVPYITAVGRKGGSNIAAAICNALLYTLTGGRRP